MDDSTLNHEELDYEDNWQLKAWQGLIAKCRLIDDDPELVVIATAFNCGNQDTCALAADLITSALSPEGKELLEVLSRFGETFRNDSVRRLFYDYSVALLASAEGFEIPTYAPLTRNTILVELLKVTETRLDNLPSFTELIGDPRVSSDLVQAAVVAMAPPGAWIESTSDTLYDDIRKFIEKNGGNIDDYDIRVVTEFRHIDGDERGS